MSTMMHSNGLYSTPDSSFGFGYERFMGDTEDVDEKDESYTPTQTARDKS